MSTTPEKTVLITGANAGLGPAITLTVAAGYGTAIAALLAALSLFRTRAAATAQ